ncbi:hypothetical protein GGS23DRAFT_529567 [Durotheca rogersii]|uniref:uncharacterized protein n=1 Tax=Durotheca rogersii TaxID=419775 RepID=UPI002220A33E|nr:uncharacterized protein GGS23DRAFT_529567 [Durotheca rogersii]KAI5863367.1 hypothetical protein GGS23DRAFT_529567 [Durotheca rogersii]
MSADLSWEPEFCLACDRQTDGATYCSESCRLSDFEKTSASASTPASSPGLAGYSWTAPRSQAKFHLPPAYDFSNAQPYGSTPLPQSYLSQRSESSSGSSARVLTPSSSHSSLCSLGSTSSSSASGSEGTQLSDKAKKQLRDYASSFEHARLQQRRRSY